MNRLSRLVDAVFRRRLLNRLVAGASALFSLAPGQVVSGRPARHLPPPSYVKQPRAYAAPTTPVVGFLGFWGGAKGIETLIQALAYLRDEGLPCRAIIGGSTGDTGDTYSRAIRGLAARSGIDAEFPGFLPDDRMESFVSGLSALVIPYLREHPASSSGVAVWGLSLGVPVVASDVPALRRQLGDSAAYFEPGDAKELAVALRSVLHDQEAAVTRAREGQARFYREHDDEVIGRLLAGYVTDSVATR